MKLTAPGAQVISVLTMSADAARRLHGAPPDAGQVHSVFERALNLDWHDGRLLTLHGPGPLLAPFAAALARFPAGAVRQGRPVRRRDETITLDGIVLEWDGAATVDTAMLEASSGRDPVTPLLSTLPQVERSSGLSSMSGRRARLRLSEGLRHRECAAFVEGALGLLGLGEGLTPAGDDCLVGVLAVIHRFAPTWFHAHPEIESIIRAASATATTRIAHEFITHALAGHFAESLVDLMMAQSAEAAGHAAAQLLRTGATSGADTISGIRLALAAVGAGGRTSAS
jgi:Protein of unknown function (DUF2877)